jgi:hypothetical protein
MSESWRQRLERRRIEIGIDGPEYDYIKRYIEFYCSEADRKCKEINMKKTVDEVIDSMTDDEFDQFTKAVIDSEHKRLGFDAQASKKKKKKSKETETEEYDNVEPKEAEIPA